MDSLPESAAALVASHLVAERDLASLCGSCTFWRDVLSPQNEPLWQLLLRRRFGDSAGSAGAAASSAQRFRRAAQLRRPAAGLDKIVWLDGQHLQEAPEPGSTFGSVVKVLAVCWLELCGWFPGVLPGRYRVAWRVRLEGQLLFDQAMLIARVEQPPAPLPGCQQQEAAQEQQQGHEQEQQEHATMIDWQLLSDARQQEGSRWFELLGDPFDVPQPSSVFVGFNATSGNWKRGLVFDTVRLCRLPPSPPAEPAAPAASTLAQQAQLAVEGVRGTLQRLSRGLQGLLGL